MKKLISLFLSFIMILTVFVGCSNDSSSDDNDDSTKKNHKGNSSVSDENYDSDEDEDKIEIDKPISSTVSGPTLPSPDAYFNNQLARSEDIYKEDYGYHCLGFKTDSDSQQAFYDYIALLSQDKYQLELTAEQGETIYDVQFLRYSFMYTGTEDVPEVHNKPNNMSGDLLVYIQHNIQSGSVLINLYYKPDAFEFKDFGDRTSYTMKDLSGKSNSNMN